jgi:cyclophilin family peptidyl-prolyl cis-trans isomerase
MKKNTLVYIVLAILVVAVGIILFMRSKKAPPPVTAPGTVTTRQAISPSLQQPASLGEKAPDDFWTKFDTTKGAVVVQVTRSWAPHGADRFYNLVKNGFYNGASFFRVLPGFIVQFGISPNPDISQVWQSADIPDDPVQQSNVTGTITFATAGPDTRTTQVFINLADNKNLDSQGFAPFGKVTGGMDVARSLYSGYGEGAPMGSGPDQHLIQTEGAAYLAQNFPKLDHIKSAVILQSAPDAAAR